MKKKIYILLFVILGVLIQFLVHALLEIWYIGLLLEDFDRHSLGFSWEDWVVIHHVGSIALLFVGVAAGFQQGKFWWRKIYGEHALERWLPWRRKI